MILVQVIVALTWTKVISHRTGDKWVISDWRMLR
jgi:hypothetical protein